MSVKVTEKDIQYVANLARLDVPESEIQSLTQKMENIVAMAGKLSEVDTSGVAPASLAIDLQNVFREDVVVPSYSREEMIANAPTKSAGCYSVPQTFDE